MNAVIIYDDSALAAKANATLARAADRADAAVPWSVIPWRLDLLMRQPTADKALHDAEGAHLIVLALRDQTTLPAWLFDWLEQWAQQRLVNDAALAIWDGGDTSVLLAPATNDLSRFAGRHGLSFVFDNDVPMESEVPLFGGNLDDREVMQVPIAAHIRGESPRDYFRGWGINE